MAFVTYAVEERLEFLRSVRFVAEIHRTAELFLESGKDGRGGYRGVYIKALSQGEI